jgi:hypothetical protein
VRENLTVLEGKIGKFWAVENGGAIQLVSVYRIFWKPLPQSKEAGTVERYEGYFYCLSDLPDPARFVSELLLLDSEAEVIYFKLGDVGEIGTLLGNASTRAQVDEKGYTLKLGNIVDSSHEPPVQQKSRNTP